MSISNLVKEAMAKDEQFFVFKNAIAKPPTEKELYTYFTNKVLHKDEQFLRSRGDIPPDHYSYFGDMESNIKELYDLFCVEYRTTFIRTSLVNEVWASMHNDDGHTVHFNCLGRVRWRLQNKEGGEIHEVVLEPGDILYFKPMVQHETIPLTTRYGYIFTTCLDILDNG